jgi:ADP-dependent NAD(P)H-hydrate dehydratase / NAD(P)H-hydrate epimerase
MKLFTTSQMRQADEQAVQAGIPLQKLMERSGQAIAETALQRCPKAEDYLILCGKGNNGGDGYVAARFLKQAGKQVTVLELSTEPKGEAKIARLVWLRQGTTGVLNIATLESALPLCNVIIDALLGTGLTRALDDDLSRLVETINRSGKFILSVDVPSGAGSDSGELLGSPIQATHTVQLAGAKVSSAFYPAKKAFGTWEVADIGIPKNILESLLSLELLTDKLVKPWLPQREATAHKYTVGTVLVIAGSSRYLGAAELACRAAYRAGAGLVTLAAEARFSNSWPEIIFESLSWRDKPLETLQAVSDKRAQVRVIGPGLGDEAQRFLPDLIRRGNAPTVLDAGALLGDTIWTDAVREHGRCVLTPHVGEAAKLLRVSSQEVAKFPLESATTLAKKLSAVIVLKGATSIIASPTEQVFVSTRGHSGMATGGSGDVLAGCLAAWCAHAETLFERVAATVYTHGLAGEAAATSYGNGLVASDLTEYFPKVWQGLEATNL